MRACRKYWLMLVSSFFRQALSCLRTSASPFMAEAPNGARRLLSQSRHFVRFDSARQVGARGRERFAFAQARGAQTIGDFGKAAAALGLGPAGLVDGARIGRAGGDRRGHALRR